MGGNGGVGIRGTVVFNYGSVNTVGGSGGNGGLKGDSGSNGRAGSVGKGIAGTLTYPAAASAQDSNDNSTWSDLTETSSNERYVRFYYRPVIVGDTNGDYEVTVSDAVTIVNYLLGNASDDFDANAADMNHDGHVTISDAVTVVNMATSD